MAGVKGSRAYPFKIAAGLETSISLGGEFFYVLTCDQPDFLLGMDEGALDYTKFRTYKRVEAGTQYESLRISNPNATELNVVIIAGFGEYGDDEVAIGGSVSISDLPDVVLENAGTHTPGADLVVGTGVGGNIAAAPTRKEVIMQASGTLRLSSVTSKGFEWDGGQMTLTSKAKIDFFNDTGAAVTVTFTELLA